jgi:hypothetical protein
LRLHPTSDSHVKQPRKIISNECGYGFAISRRGAPEVCGKRLALVEKRARGTPDARCVRSLMRKVKSARVSHHGRTGYIRRSARGGFVGLLRALPGSDSSAWVRHRRPMLTSPLRLKRTATHRLDASDGHRDHTTWAGAQSRCRWGASPPRPHRAASSSARGERLTDPRHGGDPPCRETSRRTLPRPPHPAPRIVTIASRPSHRDGMV